jgi:hypothetical protein
VGRTGGTGFIAPLGEGSLGAIVFGAFGGLRCARTGGGFFRRQGVGYVAAAEFLGFGGAQLAFGDFAQSFQLLGIEFAEVAGLLIED